ncbi:MAG TPA: hypothetical protein VN030_05500 [Cellvibrio sp.]|nr:hypothetical protein [Cellvibrio sp.]
MHIEHINISAPMELLGRLKLFYCELFDLNVGFRPAFRRRGFWLYSGSNPIIHLTESSEHYQHEKQGYLDHIAFQSEGLNELLVKLQCKNVPYSIDSLPEIGMTQVFFSDPSGLGLEVNFLNETAL